MYCKCILIVVDLDHTKKDFMYRYICKKRSQLELVEENLKMEICSKITKRKNLYCDYQEVFQTIKIVHNKVM